MVKAFGPHNIEGSVMVTQSLEHTKNPATAGPVFYKWVKSLGLNFLEKETPSIIFTGTKVQLALLDYDTQTLCF